MTAVTPGTPASAPTSPMPQTPAPAVKAKGNFKLATNRARAKRLQKFEEETLRYVNKRTSALWLGIDDDAFAGPALGSRKRDRVIFAQSARASHFQRPTFLPLTRSPTFASTACAFLHLRSENLELVKTGKLDLDTARNLSVFASHAEIGELSLGLGQYFGAIVHFAGLMIALFIFVGCFHLHEFRTNNNLSSKYLVVVKLSNWNDIPRVVYSWCEKSDDDYKKETISIISNSAGTRCNNNMTSSFYNCPTVCTYYTWNPEPWSEARDLEWNGNGLCAKHLPCGMADLTEEERSLCCVETLAYDTNLSFSGWWDRDSNDGSSSDDRSRDDISSVYGKGGSEASPEGVYGVQVLTVVIVLAWILNYHRRQLVIARQVNEANITTADYTVAVSGLGDHEFRREDLANHMAHYGEVVACVYTKNIGALLAAEEKYQAAVNTRDEIRSYRAKLAADDAERLGDGRGPRKTKRRPFGYAFARLRKRMGVFLFNVAVCGGPGTEAHLRKLEARVKERRAKCVEAARVPIKNVGEAFVTFNYETHLNNCFEDHRRPFLERTLTYAFPKWKIGAPKFRDKILTVEAPPEPSDVSWANYGQSRGKRRVKNALAFLGMLAALFLGVGLQIQFQQLRDAARIESYDRALYSRATGTETALEDAAAIQSLTMISSFVIVAVNAFLSFAAKELSIWQKFRTQSEFEASLMLKLTVVHVINSILVPAAFSSCPRENVVPSGTDPEGGDWYGGHVHSPSYVAEENPSVPGGVESNTGKALMAENGKCLWYAPGGLVETAFYLQLFNAILPNVIAYVDVLGRLRRKYLARHARTQIMMDVAVEPPDFILATKYATQCKTVALAMVYGPILPVSYVLALFALFVSYFTDKILALKRCKKPVRQQNQATERVVLFMNVMALVQCVSSGVLFYDFRFPGYVFACVVLWILYQLLPLNRWLGIERDVTTEDGGTGDLAFWSAMGKAGGKGRAPGRSGQRDARPPRDEEDYARQAAARRFKSKLLNVPESELEKDRLDIYFPTMPITAGEKIMQMIIDGYKLPHMITPGNAALMRRQKAHTGGRARVAPPFRTKETQEASDGVPKPSALGRALRMIGMGGASSKVSPAGTPRSGSAAGMTRSGSAVKMTRSGSAAEMTRSGSAADVAHAKPAAAPPTSPKLTTKPSKKETDAAIKIQAAARGRAARRGA